MVQDRLPLLPGGTASDPLPDKGYLFHIHLLREVVSVKSLEEHIIRPEIQAEKEFWELDYIRKKKKNYLCIF